MSGSWSVIIKTVYDPEGRTDAGGGVYIVYKAIATTTRNFDAEPVPPTGWSVSVGTDKRIQQIVAYADSWSDMCVKISSLTPYNENPIPVTIGG